MSEADRTIANRKAEGLYDVGKIYLSGLSYNLFRILLSTTFL
jgi:hypothetical protein